ncbi:MAG: hypothetical protein HFF03_05670 [Oscillospiraceae bacterium]|nr:hypothetical protein [Oscillospiraceae bacterium]
MSMFLALTMVVGLGSYAFAAEIETASEEDGKWELKYFEDGLPYLENSSTGTEVTAVFKFDNDGNLCPVDLIEYANKMNNPSPVEYVATSLEDEEIVPYVTTTVTWYRQSKAYKDESAPVEKLSVDFDNTIKLNMTVTMTVSHSFKFDFNASKNFTTQMKDAVKGGASFSWQGQVSKSITMSAETIADKIPEGRKGFIAFTPYYMVTEGTLYEQVIDVDTGDSSTPKEYKVTAKSAIKLSNGWPDGYLRVELVK